uniref:Scarecrow-like protein 6 n=1 Tax=Rhizophora mucronata TaxID=61149 RepID=A0A2P2L3U8_RHIMU
MKAMPQPFEDCQGKGVLGFSSSSPLNCFPQQKPQNQVQEKWQNSNRKENCCFVGSEPTSVFDTIRSPSPQTSSSTLSSSQGGANGGGGGGGASTDTTTTGVVAAAAAVSGNPSADIVAEKCGGQQQLGMEDWESVLSGSPSQEPSILRLIEDPSLGLNKLLPSGSGPQEMEFNAGFGVVDQVFGFDSLSSANIDPSAPHGQSSDFPLSHNARIAPTMDQSPSPIPAALLSAANCSLLPGMFQHQEQQPQVAVDVTDEKPQIFHTQMIINQNQSQVAQNPAMFLPLSYAQLHEHHLLSPPPTKRHNPGPVGANGQVQKAPFSDPRPEFFLQRQQQQQHQLQTLSLNQQRPAMMKQKFVTDELVNPQLHQQAIINPICQAAELIETGNLVLAQGILARLNHQLSLPIGKPYHRVAFYFKEALQLLLHTNTITNSSTVSASSLIFKIGAYKSFSEISPILQFANFTCNQALLEAFEGFDRIHIVDFDIGYGGQWASLMPELTLRSGGAPSLKITAFASPSSHSELELGFTQENLRIFAREIHMPFELEILSLESLNSGSWPMPLHVLEKEAIAVNLPIGSFSSFPTLLPLVLRFVKQLSPKIVASMDRGCERTDLPFAHHVNQAIQSYSSLLESLDAVNMNPDSLHKIERFLVQPGIEKTVLGRQRCPDRSPPWRSLFLQSGFSPLTFSNITESQAECLVQRTPVKGFHVEKKQSSLVLCWQRKELVSVSAWRC